MASNSGRRSSSSASRPSETREGQRGTAPAPRGYPELRSRRVLGAEDLGARPSVRDGRRARPTRRVPRDLRHASYFARLSRLIALVVIVVFVIAAYLVATKSSLFAIRTVTATPTTHVSAETISSLAAVPANSTLFGINEGEICDRIKQNPWVADVTITRTFPDTLNIQVTERTEGAIVMMPNNSEAWRISTDGYWLEAVALQSGASAATPLAQATAAAKGDGVVLVTEAPKAIAPQAGAACTDEAILGVLTYMRELPSDLRAQIVSFKASSIQGIAAILGSGVEVSLGAPTGDVAWKGQVALQILKNNAGAVTYVNVRTPDTPSWRGLDASMVADAASGASATTDAAAATTTGTATATDAGAATEGAVDAAATDAAAEGAAEVTDEAAPAGETAADPGVDAPADEGQIGDEAANAGYEPEGYVPESGV